MKKDTNKALIPFMVAVIGNLEKANPTTVSEGVYEAIGGHSAGDFVLSQTLAANLCQLLDRHQYITTDFDGQTIGNISLTSKGISLYNDLKIKVDHPFITDDDPNTLA